MSFALWIPSINAQNTFTDNFGETDVFGMNWSAEVLSGEELENCCEELVIEFTFVPDLPLSGPEDAYAELWYFFGDPNDLVLENCTLVFDQIVQGYKVVVDRTFSESELENGVFTARVT